MAKAEQETTTVGAGLSLQEAIARACSFEALRAFLAPGRIRACAERFYTATGGPPPKHDRDIPPSWWQEARFDSATHRVYFTLALTATDTGAATYQVFAVGIELERTAAEALLPPKAEDKSTEPVLDALEPKQWVSEAAKRLREASDRPVRKNKAAKRIESEMEAAVAARTCTRKVSVGTIKNLMGPWP